MLKKKNNKKRSVIKMATRKRKTIAVGSSSSCTSKSKQSKRQASKETFLKWQRTYEKEYQSMGWLHAEMDNQDKSLVSTLWCVVCRQYENKICGIKTFLLMQQWIYGGMTAHLGEESTKSLARSIEDTGKTAP